MSSNPVPNEDTQKKDGRHTFPALIRKDGDSGKYSSNKGPTKGKCHFREEELDDVLWEIAAKEWDGKRILGRKSFFLTGNANRPSKCGLMTYTERRCCYFNESPCKWSLKVFRYDGDSDADSDEGEGGFMYFIVLPTTPHNVDLHTTRAQKVRKLQWATKCLSCQTANPLIRFSR
jgi:hypothetical protein